MCQVFNNNLIVVVQNSGDQMMPTIAENIDRKENDPHCFRIATKIVKLAMS